MKITVERSALLKSLTHVNSVVARNSTIPILANALLHTSAGRLGLTATDLDVSIADDLEADITEDGKVTVPASVLFNIVGTLTEGAQVEIARTGSRGQLALSSGQARFSLQSLPEEDFPKTPDTGLEHGFSLPVAGLKQLIEKSAFAISTEESRYYLNGIYLHVATDGPEPTLRAVATDGHRLARVDVPHTAAAKAEMPSMIVPQKTVALLGRLLADAEDGEDGAGAEVKISAAQNQIRLEFGQIVLTSKLIDGTFPDYQRVIPTDNDKIMTAPRQEFIAAVSRVAAIAFKDPILVKLNLGADTLTLAVSHPEYGDAKDEMTVAYAGEPLEIGFNARYMLDIAERIVGENVRFDLADAGAPAVIHGDEGEGVLYVLMPMRV